MHFTSVVKTTLQVRRNLLQFNLNTHEGTNSDSNLVVFKSDNCMIIFKTHISTLSIPKIIS